jgi:(p)ppGpp synthase/HD superfamily hydrolase
MKETRKTFIERITGKMTSANVDLVMFAYDLSKEAHRTHSRALGGRYFEHPRAGCLILMDELGIYDPDLLIAFLLHDVGEDSPLLGSVKGSYDEFVRTVSFRSTLIFSPRATRIIIRLTKPSIDGIRFHTKQECLDYYEQELSKDEEAQIGKATDRLHNLRTIPYGTAWARKTIVETRSVYLPMFKKATGSSTQVILKLVEKIEAQIQILETVPI